MQINSNKNYKKSKNAKPVFSETGRVIGKVENSIFKKTIQGSKHFLHTPPAIGFDVYAIEQAVIYGAIWVEVYDRETGIIYRASIQQIRNDGLKLNRGYGRQIALLLSSWDKHTKGGSNQMMLNK